MCRHIWKPLLWSLLPQPLFGFLEKISPNTELITATLLNFFLEKVSFVAHWKHNPDQALLTAFCNPPPSSWWLELSSLRLRRVLFSWRRVLFSWRSFCFYLSVYSKYCRGTFCQGGGSLGIEVMKSRLSYRVVLLREIVIVWLVLFGKDFKRKGRKIGIQQLLDTPCQKIILHNRGEFSFIKAS